MQTKTTMSGNLKHGRMAIMKKARINIWQECDKKGTLVCTWLEYKLVQPP